MFEDAVDNRMSYMMGQVGIRAIFDSILLFSLRILDSESCSDVCYVLIFIALRRRELRSTETFFTKSVLDICAMAEAHWRLPVPLQYHEYLCGLLRCACHHMLAKQASRFQRAPSDRPECVNALN
jgi:hypothetical protein